MRTSRLLAPLLLSLLLATSAVAQGLGISWLNDPALTPTVSTDSLVLSATAVSATQTSIEFVEAPSPLIGVFAIQVSACDTCNMTLSVQAKDPDGTWFNYGTYATAITGTGTSRVCFGCTSSTNTGFNQVVAVRLPPRFRVNVLWNSGTSASYTVTAWVFN